MIFEFRKNYGVEEACRQAVFQLRRPNGFRCPKCGNSTGEVRSVQDALAPCWFYVLPLFYQEGTPGSVLEAMAAGRPIISTAALGCRKTVEHRFNGLMIPPRDARALVDSMIRMIESRHAEIQRMAAASLVLAREKFDVNKVNQRMLEIMGL